jgi:DNA-binding GntR family transcriptional regulator
MPRPRLEADLYSTTTPVYRQIAGQIRAYIESGEVAAHDRLWSAAEISQETGVAVNTARHAIAVLAQEGLILVVQGRGNFVAPRDT